MGTSKEQRMLGKAISVATVAHDKQFDRAGMPYILHPLHVMSFFMDDYELAAIAVLHDAVEDSVLSLEALRVMGMSGRVLAGVDFLTHRDGIKYEDYIDRIIGNDDAVLVKIRDIEHNTNLLRLSKITDKDISRVQKYALAYATLIGSM